MNHTIASIQDKSPEELNYLCEQALGFEPSLDYHNRSSLYFGAIKGPTGWRQARPYATSYDAIMREIVNLPHELQGVFADKLERVTSKGPDGNSRIFWRMCSASPADLTRALILTFQTHSMKGESK